EQSIGRSRRIARARCTRVARFFQCQFSRAGLAGLYFRTPELVRSGVGNGSTETRSVAMAVDSPAADVRADTDRLRRRAVRGGTLLLAARLGTQLFQWSVTLVVVRLLEPDDYGMMTAGVLFVGLADMLSEAGIGKALIHKQDLIRADLAQ